MSRRSRRTWRRRVRAALAVLGGAAAAVFLAALIAPLTDAWADPEQRSAVYVLALLVAYAAGSLVVGSRRRRT